MTEFDAVPDTDPQEGSGGDGQKDGGGKQPRVSEEDLNRLRSIKDREVAQARQETELERQERLRLQAELERLSRKLQTFEQSVYDLDPSAAQALAREAEIEEIKAERDQLRELIRLQQQQREAEARRAQWRQEQEQAASARGVNPYDPRYQAAINEALRTGAWDKPRDVLIDLVLESQGAQPAPRQASQEPAPEPRRAAMTPPPRGGRPNTDNTMALEELEKEYRRRLNRAKARRNQAEIPEIRQWYFREKAKLGGD